jgi:hypothetical protein
MASMRLAPYYASVMNVTTTIYGQGEKGNDRYVYNDQSDTIDSVRVIQKRSLAIADEASKASATSATGDKAKGKNAIGARDVVMTARTRLAFGLVVGLGGGALVLLTCFALFRVNGYCKFRRKNVVKHYIGDSSSRRTTNDNYPKDRGTMLSGSSKDRRTTHSSTTSDRRTTQSVSPRDPKGTHTVVPKGSVNRPSNVLRGGKVSHGGIPPGRQFASASVRPGRRVSPIGPSSKSRRASRVPSIAELDGQGVSAQTASLIKKKQRWEKKPLPLAPQLRDSDLVIVVDMVLGRNPDSPADTRYNLHGL